MMSAENQKTILLVEDEVIIAMTETMTLEKFGYNVITANSGEEAVATFEKTPGIDLILIDINLGTGIDGTEAAAIILQQRDLPVVFLSSHTEPEVVAKTEKISSYGYVVKDSSGTVLDASIKMAFKLFEAIIKEKEKESQMEAALAALRESEARLAEAQAVAKVGSWETDLSNLNVIWSKETYRIFEIDPGCVHLTQASFLAFTHPEDCAKVDAAFLGSLDTRSLNAIEHRIVTPSGLVKFIEDRWRIFQDDQGRPVRAVGTCQDITERKQAEEAIFQSKKDWEDCFNSITDMITIHDNDYNIIRANKAGKALLKLPEFEKHLKLKCFSFYHGTDAPPTGCPSCDCLKSGIPGVFELFEPYLNRYLEIRAIPRFDSNNQRAGLIHIVRDITERKREESKREVALAALQENEERMKAIIEGTPHLFFYTQDAEANTTYVSPTVEQVTGHKVDIWLKRKDWFVTDAAINQAAKERTQANLLGEFIEEPILLEIRHALGHPILLEVYEYPITKDGKVVGLQGVAHDITQRKQAEEAFLREKAFLDQLVESAPEAIVLAENNGQILQVNSEFEKMFGYSAKEAIGRLIDDLLVPPKYRLEATDVTQTVAQGEKFSLETVRRRKDGALLHVSLVGSPILIGGEQVAAYGIYRDISDRKQAEASLKQALNWQQTIFEGSQDAIFISDQDSRFVAVNNAACDLTGYSREQLLKMRIPDIHDLPDLDAYKMYHQRIFGGEEILSEAKILRSDSAKIDTEFNNRCVSIAGKLYMHTTARDITTRKRAEEEIKRQLAEKEILLKEVHHRIKNNIASIGGLLSLHVQSATNPEAIAVLQEAIGRVNSMRILYDKLLFSEGYKDVSVKNYVESLVDSVISLFPDMAKIALDKQINDFHLDSKQLFPLGIIINELLTNIMKYAFVNRDAGLVKISLTNVDNRVTLTIQDNGIGLPAGFDINEPEGFGLKLVKMLSQQLGGSFSIKKHAGTRCKIEFNI